jgi:glycosyltransferase involved in cell wall biosynthesis
MLSVCIITKNEEEELPRCLSSVKDIADEIIVIDDNSSDRTRTIAKEFGAKVYVHELENFASQKNYALGKATEDWVFFIDADEECTQELRDAIRQILTRAQDDGTNGYLIPRRNIILGKEIKYSRWSPDKHIWLFKREKGKWIGRIHEEVHVDGKVGEITSAKIHYQYKTVTEFLAMVNNYTEREADQKVGMGEKFSYFMLFYAPLLSFFRRFLYKQGFRDGWRGFILSYMMAIYRMTTWIKVWEKQDKLLREKIIYQ